MQYALDDKNLIVARLRQDCMATKRYYLYLRVYSPENIYVYTLLSHFLVCRYLLLYCSLPYACTCVPVW